MWWWVLLVNMVREIPLPGGGADSLSLSFQWTLPLIPCVYLAVWRFCWRVRVVWVQTGHCSLCWTLWSHPDWNFVERHHRGWYVFVVMLWQQGKHKQGSRVGTAVRALTSHQCGLGSFPAWCHMWVEFVVGSRLALRVLSRFAGWFSKPTLQIPIWSG